MGVKDMQQESIRINVEPVGKKFDSPGDVVLNVTLHNAGGGPITIDLSQASSPSLSLQVEDSAGKRLLLPSPCVPDAASKRLTLAPGESYQIQMAGIFDLGQPGGDYRVRYHYTDPLTQDILTSEWVQITVYSARLPVVEPIPRARTIWVYWLFCIFVYRILGLLFKKRCRTVAPAQVDRALTETITNAPPPNQAWNNTYSWHARFLLLLDQPLCRITVIVRLRINGAATAAQQTAWKNAIEQKWSNRFKLCCREDCCTTCCLNGYTIFCDLQFVQSTEHHVVTGGANTVNMTNWGSADTIDVTHEFGHMLGNKEEYFTVDGINYGAPRQPGGNVMNNPANDPVASHFDLVRQEAENLIGAGTRCVIKAVNEVC
jgi:hypothetical protein